MTEEKQFYSWEEFFSDIHGKMIPELRHWPKKFNGVYGIPRGGLITAVILSHHLNIPFLTRPKDTWTLIVDDIVDTGKTLLEFRKKDYIILTLFYHSQSIVVPDYWLRKKEKQWIIFPWGKEAKPLTR